MSVRHASVNVMRLVPPAALALVLDARDSAHGAPVDALLGDKVAVRARLAVSGCRGRGAKLLLALVALHRLELGGGHVRKLVDGHPEGLLTALEGGVVLHDALKIVAPDHEAVEVVGASVHLVKLRDRVWWLMAVGCLARISPFLFVGSDGDCLFREICEDSGYFWPCTRDPWGIPLGKNGRKEEHAFSDAMILAAWLLLRLCVLRCGEVVAVCQRDTLCCNQVAGAGNARPSTHGQVPARATSHLCNEHAYSTNVWHILARSRRGGDSRHFAHSP